MNRRQFIKLATGAFAVLGSYSFAVERYWIQVNTYRVPVPRLPDAFQGFRIVHLTDLHFGFLMPQKMIQKVIQKANEIPRDLIVCTGDYVREYDAHSKVDKVWPLLSELHAPYGVHSVLGNHDHWSSFEQSLEWMTQTGQNLRHQSRIIQKSGEQFWLGGAGDFWEDELGIDTAFRDTPNEDCKIVLAHNPDSADQQYKTRIDLMLSGHTHGGQVRIPYFTKRILPVINKQYSYGFIHGQKTNVFISRGIGWAVTPFRFNCPPEIAVLILDKENFNVEQA
ncbi:metallophosphoesterase [bacterium]